MINKTQLYIGGRWVDPLCSEVIDVENPATGTSFARVALGDERDVDAAVKAARAAFGTFSLRSRAEQRHLLAAIAAAYESRLDEIAEVIMREVGTPITKCRQLQAPAGMWHINSAIRAFDSLEFEHWLGPTRIVREPIGVVGLIAPWNWPLDIIARKVVPALAVGCTVVLKPSELAPLSGLLFAEIMHEAGVPAGAFNLVNGRGDVVGTALAEHPQIDAVSFTGSPRAGALVAQNAARTIKRVTQELGGKSACILLEDGDAEAAVHRVLHFTLMNCGQSCIAPTRLFVPESRKDEVHAIALRLIQNYTVGDPADESTVLGPVNNQVQYDRVQTYIEAGLDEGATLLCGGPGRPDGFPAGYFVKPTLFGDVRNDFRIAQEEIFGPVIAIIPYADEEEAVRLANDTVYGLAAYIYGVSPERTAKVARQLRAGAVSINGAWDIDAPVGGYKQSGNGREGGIYGLHEFLETKSVFGDTFADT